MKFCGVCTRDSMAHSPPDPRSPPPGVFGRLNGLIDSENRKFDGQFGSCTSRQIHTPTVHQMGLIAFRDRVLLWTAARAKGVQGAMTLLADEEARVR